MRDIAIVPNADGKTYDIRTMLKGWGIVGPRLLKQKYTQELPAHKGLTIEKALEVLPIWQKFVDEQDKRINQSARRKARS
tara:strand:- start:29 stop:268 length:240 start_codon:yes stop_codon:yes gene_type:complete